MTHCSDSESYSDSDENYIGSYTHFFPISDLISETKKSVGQCEHSVKDEEPLAEVKKVFQYTILPTTWHPDVRCSFVSQKLLQNFLVSIRIHLCTIPYNTGLSGKILKARGCRCEQQLSDHPKIFVNIFFGGNYVVKESGDFCPGLQRRHIYLTQGESLPRIPSKVQKEICRVN